ncbi:MAG: stage II sporulation protein P [Clostridia bacterium]|nr:stage II sporulation protein P [Clostridia bacterium]
MKKVLSGCLMMVLITLALIPNTALADDWFEPDPGYYTLMDDSKKELTVMAREISVDDEYISGDNKHYIVTKVDRKKREAHTRLIGEITLPAVSQDDSIAAAQQKDGNILLYCTHNSESYVPSDGEESTEGDGGINDVAKSLADNLKERGINAVFKKESHDPHDAGAYRRSRQTAIKLIKEKMPVQAVFDIHRDAVPKDHDVTEVDGQNMSMIRIVLGRRNQNRDANEELAKKIKSVADKAYPGLIKDIFIGKGGYNQELSPRSLLLELGTHENSKKAAQKSTAYLAEVISKSMYGGSVKEHSQDTEDDDREAEDSNDNETKITPINRDAETKPEGSGGRSGIIWLLVIVVVGFGAFLFISMGGRELRSKFKGRK